MKLGVSLINVDQLNLFEDLELISGIGGIDYLHIDIMDLHYVPRYGINPEILPDINKFFDFHLDIHLMIDNPLTYFHLFERDSYKADYSIHLNKYDLKLFESLNIKPKVVINLNEHLVDFLEHSVSASKIKGFTFMGILPGVLLQEHRPDVLLDKIPIFSDFFNDYLFEYQIDGGFNFKSAKLLKQTGANSFIGGSNSFCYQIYNNQSKADKRALYQSNINQIISLLEE